MDFELNEELTMLRETAREFAASELKTKAREMDKREEFDRSVFTAMAGLGLTALTIPEQYGGAGFYEGKMANQAASIALEEVNRWCASTGVTLSVHMSLFSSLLTKWGNDEQKARVLPKMASGEWLGAYCLSEAGSGTDAGSLACEAKKDGDEYVLNGSKLWITSAPYADVFIVLARTSHEHKTRGITCLVVEKGTPGMSHGAPEKKLGWNASPTAQLIFEDCRVPVANRVGAEGEGFGFAMAGLDGGRLNIGACSLGGAQRCLDEAIAYTKDRQQFGQPVAEFQNTQFTLADMATDLEAARALLYLAACKVTAGAPDKSRFSAMAKRLATDSGSNVVNNALQLFGGYGYLKEYPIERFWRDLRVHSILEGTNQVMRMIVGRDLLRQ